MNRMHVRFLLIYSYHLRGGMCERLKQAVLKTALPERVTGVRIPLPPPPKCSAQLRDSNLSLVERAGPAKPFSRPAALGRKAKARGSHILCIVLKKGLQVSGQLLERR